MYCGPSAGPGSPACRHAGLLRPHAVARHRYQGLATGSPAPVPGAWRPWPAWYRRLARVVAAATRACHARGPPAQPSATRGGRQPGPGARGLAAEATPGSDRLCPQAEASGCGRWWTSWPQQLAWHHAGGWPGHPAWRVPRPSGRTAGPARAAGGASCPAHGRLPVPQACPQARPAVRRLPYGPAATVAPTVAAGGCPASCHEAGSPATRQLGYGARPPASAPSQLVGAAATAGSRVASLPHLPAPRASAAGPTALAAGPVREVGQAGSATLRL